MATLEKRIEALENSASDDRLKVVTVQDGESESEALQRVGLPPDARGVVFLSPLDALL